MSEVRRVLRVFIASPSDVMSEREIVRATLGEVNALIARSLGYEIEAVGWEETVSAAGRPQGLINQRLDGCGLFIGMMWRRWGSAPDKVGRFTSGFQEEFEISAERYRKSGDPDIKLFFKEIDAAQLADPGPELQRVLDFRRRTVEEKEFYYETFLDGTDLEKKVRRCLADFLWKLKSRDDAAVEAEQGVKPSALTQVDRAAETRNDDGENSSTRRFLRLFGSGGAEGNWLSGVTATDVARIRLIANSISRPGNQESHIGVHDANILYAQRKDLDLGRTEIFALVDCGLRHFRSENVPLWHWYSSVRGKNDFYLAAESFLSMSEGEKIGAICAMRLIGAVPPDIDEHFSREYVLANWFESSVGNDTRLEGLRYLSLYGRESDIAHIRSEIDRNNSSTLATAIDALLSILLRERPVQVGTVALSEQFESASSAILQRALEDLSGVDVELLLSGTEHPNEAIRLRCGEELQRRKQLSPELSDRLLNDNSAKVRYWTLRTLLKTRPDLQESDVKRILVKPKSRGLGLASLFGGTDREGEETFKNYRISQLSDLSEADLANRARDMALYDHLPYFVMCEQYFEKHSSELRFNIEDRFKKYFEDNIELLIRSLGTDQSADHVVKLRNREAEIRKQLTRYGLDVLCRKGKAIDADSIRENLKSGYAGASEEDIKFLGRIGKWSDIELIVAAYKSSQKNGLLTALSVDEVQIAETLRALTKLIRGRLGAAVGIKMPERLLSGLVIVSTDKDLESLSEDQLFSLLTNKSERVRRAATLKACRAFAKSRIQGIFERYMQLESDRYYNVIHWFDLYLSMPQAVARRAINRRIADERGDSW